MTYATDLIPTTPSTTIGRTARKVTKHSMTVADMTAILTAGDSTSFYFGVRWTGAGYNVCDGRQVWPANAASVNAMIKSGKLVQDTTGRRSAWVLA
jgi:hypothetical protein